jgi:hypothetical protein
LLATAGVVLVTFAAVISLELTREPEEQLRPKGTWQLHTGVERSGHEFLAYDGIRLETGDRLGFFYTAEQPGTMMILYADEAGDIVLIYPAQAKTSARIDAGREVRVPDGAVVDPGRGCEWVIGLFSDRPFAIRTAHEVIRRMLEERIGCRIPARIPVDMPGMEGAHVHVLRVIR